MYPYGNNQFGGYGAPPGQPMSPNPAAPQYVSQTFGVVDPNQSQQFYGQSPALANPYGTINTNTINNFGSVYPGDNMGAYASNIGVAGNNTGGYNSAAPYATTSFNTQPAGFSTGLNSAPSYATNSFVNQSVPQGFNGDLFGQSSFPSTPSNPISGGYVAPIAPPSVDAFTGAYYMNPTDPSTYATMYIPPVDPQNTFNTNPFNNQQQQQQQQSFVSSPLSVTEELALKEGWMWKYTASTGWVQQYNIIEKSHGGYLLGFPQPPEGGAAPQSLSPLPQSKCTVVGLDEFPWDVQSLNFKDPCVFLFQCFQPPSEDIYFVCDGYDNLMDWVVKFEKFNTQLDLTGAVSYSQKAINQAIQELQQCWLPWQQDQTELRLKQEHLDNVARKKEQELYQQQQQIMQQSSFPASSSSSVANVGVIDEKQALLDQIERQKQEFERVLREQKLQMEKEYKALEDKKAVEWIKSNDDWRQFFKSSLGLSDEELQNPEIAKVLIERTLTAVHQPDSGSAQSQSSPSSSSSSLNQPQPQQQEYQQVAPQAQQPPALDQQQYQAPPAQQQPAFDQQQQYQQAPPPQQQQYQAPPAQQQQYQAPPAQQQPAFDQQQQYQAPPAQQQYQAPPAQQYQQAAPAQQQQYQAPSAQQQQYQAPPAQQYQQPAFDQQQQYQQAAPAQQQQPVFDQHQQYQAPPVQQQQYQQAPPAQQQSAFDQQQQYQQAPQTLSAEFSAASLRPPPPPPAEEAQPSQPSYSAPPPPLSQSGPPTGGPPPPPPSGGPPPPPPPPPAGGPRPPPAMPSASGPPKPKPQAAMPSIADMINAGTPQLRKVVPTDPADKPPVPSGDPRTNMFAEMKNKKLRATVIQPKQMSEDTSNDLKNILMRTLTKFRPMLKETATDSDDEKDAENW